MGFVKAESLDFVEIQLHSTKADIYTKFEVYNIVKLDRSKYVRIQFQTLLNMVNHLNPKAEDPEKGRITTDPVVQNMLANLDEYAFDSKSKS
ncbi:15293_t:CDS:2, partial [Funneliformis mosseae]